MRLDHIAYRVKDREETARFLHGLLGYRYADVFKIELCNGEVANCIAMTPPEKVSPHVPLATLDLEVYDEVDNKSYIDYHMAPEIFVSDGSESRLLADWVRSKNGIGGIHHVAYEVADVGATMEDWQAKGFEFTTDKPIACPDDDLIQCFTKPIAELGGQIIEFIKRGDKGFCKDNVAALMESTRDKDN